VFLVWFTSNPVGYNTLGGVVKKLCRDAGIEGNFTNHSLRTTLATRGLVKGIPDKLNMEKTGIET
jgi:integrase